MQTIHLLVRDPGFVSDCGSGVVDCRLAGSFQYDLAISTHQIKFDDVVLLQWVRGSKTGKYSIPLNWID